MKVRFVAPRWGPDVVGGAERALREFAEHLVDATGWEAEAVTSCATDHLTWDAALPEGESVEGGVRVLRVRTGSSGRPVAPDLDERVLRAPGTAWPGEAERWIDLQGPASLDLLEAATAPGPDVTVFSPYLYFPAVRGVPASPSPAVLHPALHDEPIARLSVFQREFAAADALVFYTEEERVLAERMFRVGARRSLVSGIGVSPPPPPPAAGQVLPEALDGRPYVLALGRVEAHKGTSLLTRYFTLFKAHHAGPLALVLAGPVGRPEPPAHRDLVVLGAVDDDTKWALLRGAEALVMPSPFESFSLVLMEAWSVGVPALVNARCPVTAGHCRRSGGGVQFGDYAQFRAALARLAGDEDLRRELGERGRSYVVTRFDWPSVIARYRTFLDTVASRGARDPQPP